MNNITLSRHWATHMADKGVRDKWRLQDGCIVRVHHRASNKFATPLDFKPDECIQDMHLQELRVARGFARMGCKTDS